MEFLDSVGARYGTRPSVLLGEEDPMKALAIDIWAHNMGVQREANPYRGGRGRHVVRSHRRR